MTRDIVDQLMDDWHRERPDVNAAGLGVTSRIGLLTKVLIAEDKRALASIDLAPWACDVLLALRRQGPPYELTPTDLRKLTLLTSGAMTARLDRLERDSLIRRDLDPGDRRSFKVGLTDEGRELADRALEARLEMVERFLSPFTAEEREAAAGLLRKLLVGARTE
ncbi:MAG: MarR family transcriptional regulator [Gemmatimonadales bacterium]|jgi:DNA-binding MarR family transcriptional regulator